MLAESVRTGHSVDTESASLGQEPRYIDAHVHCRDGKKQAYKATIREVMELARRQGIVAICDMPNTDPPIISRELVDERIALAEKEGCLEGYYLHIGITKEPAQIREAVDVIKSNPRVVGGKLYNSTGELAVTKEEDQRTVFKTLAEAGYEGVLTVHCEKESLIRNDLWDPKNPCSWNLARPPEAEVASVRDMIRFARDAGYKGHLHIPHTSVPKSVELVHRAKKDRMSITCDVTPHHLLYSTENMHGKEGLMWKVNPPIRDAAMVGEMWEHLKAGRIDFIVTDHAPHTKEEKTHPKDGKSYMSGIRSLEMYPRLLCILWSEGLGESRISELTYGNVKKVYTKIVK